MMFSKIDRMMALHIEWFRHKKFKMCYIFDITHYTAVCVLLFYDLSFTPPYVPRWDVGQSTLL